MEQQASKKLSPDRPGVDQQLQFASRLATSPIASRLGSEVSGFALATAVSLDGRTASLRPLTPADYDDWRALRTSNQERLGAPGDGRADFEQRCEIQDMAREVGLALTYGVFTGGELVGEIGAEGYGALSGNAGVYAWIDQDHLGQGLVCEAFVLLCRAAFEQAGLHRLEAAVLASNDAVRRSLEKVGVRDEGVAREYAEVNGVWQDHHRYAITATEWGERGDQLIADWVA